MPFEGPALAALQERVNSYLHVSTKPKLLQEVGPADHPCLLSKRSRLQAGRNQAVLLPSCCEWQLLLPCCSWMTPLLSLPAPLATRLQHPPHLQAENELLKVHQQQLLEKEHSGCAALLRDDKVLRPWGQLLRSLWACSEYPEYHRLTPLAPSTDTHCSCACRGAYRRRPTWHGCTACSTGCPRV